MPAERELTSAHHAVPPPSHKRQPYSATADTAADKIEDAAEAVADAVADAVVDTVKSAASEAQAPLHKRTSMRVFGVCMPVVGGGAPNHVHVFAAVRCTMHAHAHAHQQAACCTVNVERRARALLMHDAAACHVVHLACTTRSGAACRGVARTVVAGRQAGMVRGTRPARARHDCCTQRTRCSP